MGEFGNASASYRLTDAIRAVLVVPNWPAQPRLEPREDGLNEVTITAVKSHSHEAWHMVLVPDGAMLCAFAYSAGGRPPGGRRPPRTDYAMVVLVPPSRLETFQVLTERPGTDK
jgi:hypothetical protein